MAHHGNSSSSLGHSFFQTTHISALPMEIVLYILRWVVSSELDLRSLEMFSRVCRGFYISARDTEIWRLACVRYVNKKHLIDLCNNGVITK